MAKRAPTQDAKLWASGNSAAIKAKPMQLTEFEKLCNELNIPSGPEAFETQKLSAELRAFAETNRLSRYVPEPLLAAWGLPVEEYEVSL